jgi:diacylglycerol kinase family enzyme
MTPAAQPQDGKLTFTYAYAASRLKMLSLLPRTINGSHINDPAVHQHHTTHLAIELSPGCPIQVDGEVRATEVTHVDYRVLPNRLDILGAW